MAIGLMGTLTCAAKTTKRVPREVFDAFGRALSRWVNEKCGGNQTAAGKILGISQGHVSALMNGERGPGLNTLILVREKTGLSVDELLGLGPPPVDALVAQLQASFGLDVARFRADSARLLEEARVIAASARPAQVAVPKRKRKESGR